MTHLSLIFFVLLSAIFTSPANALTKISTPTLTLTPLSPTPQSEIQKIRQAVQEKVREKLDEITRDQPLKRGIIGTVSRVADTRITIDTVGGSKELSTDPNTVYIDSKRNKSSIDKIQVGQGVLCLGYLQPDNSFDAKRIVFISTPLPTSSNRLVVGRIADFSQSTSVVLLIPKQNKDLQYQIKLTSKTTVSTPANQELDINTTLKPGHLVAAIISPDPKAIKTYTTNKIISLSPPVSPTPSP